jgi:hypothetical protein
MSGKENECKRIIEPGQMAFDSVDQLFADGFVAGCADMDRHFADAVAGLFDVDGDHIALRILGGHLAVYLRAVANNLGEVEIGSGFLRGGSDLVG